eukprot:IDg21513t1
MELQTLVQVADPYIKDHGLERARKSHAFEDLSIRIGPFILFEELSPKDVVEKALGTPYAKYAILFSKHVKKAYGHLKTKSAVASTIESSKKNPSGSQASLFCRKEKYSPRQGRSRRQVVHRRTNHSLLSVASVPIVPSTIQDRMRFPSLQGRDLQAKLEMKAENSLFPKIVAAGIVPM